MFESESNPIFKGKKFICDGFSLNDI